MLLRHHFRAVDAHIHCGTATKCLERMLFGFVRYAFSSALMFVSRTLGRLMHCNCIQRQSESVTAHFFRQLSL